MPVTFMQNVRAVKTILNRLAYHSQTGQTPARMCAGLKVQQFPVFAQVQRDELPLLHVIGYTDKDFKFAGANQGDRVRNNTNVATDCVLQLILGVDRKYGMFNANGDGATPYGAMEWITLVKDAIENQATPTPSPDASLNGTCDKPVYVSVVDSGVTELAFYFFLNVSFSPKATQRGTRRDLMP